MLYVEDVELTPNPHALKFILNEILLNFETRQFSNKEEAEKDPLANGVFAIDGVESVFYMDKFITIEKSKTADWSKIQGPFIQFLKNFNTDLIPKEKEIKVTDEESNELLKQINDILDKQVRPALAGDGGGLQVIGLQGTTVKIRYQGACGTCPSAISGTLQAIEALLKRDINPSIQVVAA